MPCMISFRGVLSGDLSPELAMCNFVTFVLSSFILYNCVGTYVTLNEYIERTYYILYNKIYTFYLYNV